jgi:hypothetical protein
VLTVQGDDHQKADDPVLLDRAWALNRVIFTQDGISCAKPKGGRPLESFLLVLFMPISST